MILIPGDDTGLLLSTWWSPGSIGIVQDSDFSQLLIPGQLIIPIPECLVLALYAEETVVAGEVEIESVIDGSYYEEQTITGCYCGCYDMAVRSYAEIYRGESRRLRIRARDRNKQRKDLTGHEVYLTIRDGTDESATILASKSTVGGTIVLEPQAGDTLGEALAEIYSADTDVPAVPDTGKRLRFDVWVRTPSPEFRKIPIVKPSEFVVLPRLTEVPDP